MSKIDEEGRRVLKKFGYTDEMIEKLEKGPPAWRINNKTKKVTFIPTPKKMVRISHCLFCNYTKTTYYVLDEISYTAWEGHEVSREDYIETQGINARPSNYKLHYCDKCHALIAIMDADQLRIALLNIIKPDIGRVLC